MSVPLDIPQLKEALTDFHVLQHRPEWNEHGERDDWDRRRKLERLAARAVVEATTIQWCEVHRAPLYPETETHVGPQSELHADHCMLTLENLDVMAWECLFKQMLLVDPGSQP